MAEESIKTRSSSVVESEKDIPVVCEADVAVAGAGVSGMMAAIAAAREGAKTVLIDRFGSVGGNIGPGMFVGGSFDGKAKLDLYFKKTYVVHPWVLGGFAGLAKEFVERHAMLGGGSVPPYSEVSHTRDSNIASYVALTMLEEAGVKLFLSTFAADPICSANRIEGLFIENKTGRQAIRAKVVIDATGEADLARRAHAPVLYPKAEYHELDGHSPTGMGIWSLLAAVDTDRLKADPPERYMRVVDIDNLCQVKCGPIYPGTQGVASDHSGVVGLKAQIVRPHPKIDAADGQQLSLLEAKLRMIIFETAQDLKKNLPGFEESYLILIAPFLGVRGGPCIQGEYTLTMEDCRAGRRFNDVIYLYGEPRALRHQMQEKGRCEWTDMPYRVMIPRELDGLIAVGRSASGIPDTLLRNRMAVMHMGQAGGIAAALAVAGNVSPRSLNVKHLQERLLDSGFFLGDRARLRELGLL